MPLNYQNEELMRRSLCEERDKIFEIELIYFGHGTFWVNEKSLMYVPPSGATDELNHKVDLIKLDHA